MSKLFKIETSSYTSRIYLQACLSGLTELLAGRRAFLVTDENVEHFYGSVLPDIPRLVLPYGEETKTFATISQIVDFLLKNRADRHSLLIGCGGGVISDLTGLTAALFQRGIACAQIPTTLLAQVDASVGGKNGINFQGYKNVLGTISQPEFVLIDSSFLPTLPQREISCGLAEIAKHALIADPEMVDYLELHTRLIRELNTGCIDYLVSRSVEIKSRFVVLDEKDAGERNKLNFGHTVGHALEKVVGISHGEAVSIGICSAAAISVERGMLDLKDAVRINLLLSGLGLPTSFDADPSAILDALFKDKKRKNSEIRFVLLNGIGNPVLENIPLAELEQAIHDLC